MNARALVIDGMRGAIAVPPNVFMVIAHHSDVKLVGGGKMTHIDSYDSRVNPAGLRLDPPIPICSRENGMGTEYKYVTFMSAQTCVPLIDSAIILNNTCTIFGRQMTSRR